MVLRLRNDPVRLFGRRLLIVALFALVAAAIVGAWGAYQKERESRTLREQAQAQLADLSERQSELNSNIANLKTERGKEAVLRQQYALAAKGEGLIIIVDSPKPPPAQATSTILERLRKALSWW